MTITKQEFPIIGTNLNDGGRMCKMVKDKSSKILTNAAISQGALAHRDSVTQKFQVCSNNP